MLNTFCSNKFNISSSSSLNLQSTTVVLGPSKDVESILLVLNPKMLGFEFFFSTQNLILNSRVWVSRMLIMMMLINLVLLVLMVMKKEVFLIDIKCVYDDEGVDDGDD